MSGYQGSPAVGLDVMQRIATDLGGVRDRVTAIEQQLPARIPESLLTTAGQIIVRGTSGAEAVGPQRFLLDHATGRIASGIGTTGFFLTRAGTCAYAATTSSVLAMTYIDPADIPDGSLTLKAKLDAWALTETNPTDSTLTVEMYPVTAIGAAGTISSIGSVVVSCTLAPNLATTMYQGESTTAAIPSAGFYAVRFVHSVDPAQAMTYGYRLMGEVS